MAEAKKATQKADEKKEKYVVIRKHCLSFEIGQEVELTEKQARNLVNKVEKVQAKKTTAKKDA